MQIQIIKLDASLKKMGFQLNEIYKVENWKGYFNKLYPTVITPKGNETRLYPGDYIKL